MNGLRSAIRKKVPSSTAIKLLRRVFALPAPAARLILNDITRPRKSHKPWIWRVLKHPAWSGCWIGDGIHGLSEGQLHSRIEAADVIIFNVHGGGFRIGSCTMYMDTHLAWLTALTAKYGVRALIMSVDYRLAPEHKYPSPIEDIMRAYEYLTQDLKVHNSKILVTGDSAGAALLLEMLFVTHDPSMFDIITDDPTGHDNAYLIELPRPAACVLVSPLVTDETTSESWRDNVKYDYITQHTARVIKRDYISALSDPEMSTEYDRLLGIAKLETGFRDFLPPYVLMFVGDKEVMRDDCIALAKKAQMDGVYWQTVMEDCVHDWFCVREVVKDKTILDRADNTFVDFVYHAVVKQRETGDTIGDFDYRDSEPLEAVMEDEEENKVEDDDDDKFYSSTTGSDYSVEGVLKRIESFGIDEDDIRHTSPTVYV
ncbi:alpha/beta hydrolase fold-domain-containing protein [Spinellus fusiger]|nr:alpha/beta hydrolase fold-domain-containing protein [Spinellus fusiger]